MRIQIERAFTLCMALCLGLSWSCVKVDVSVQSQSSNSLYSNDNSWISIDDLKKRHTKKWCDPSAWHIRKERQETPAWCWAASTRVVMEHHNKKHNKETDSQCDIVKKTFRSSLTEANCCDPSIPSECVQGGWPNHVLDYYGFNYKKLAGAVNDWDALRGEICSIGPIISVIEWNGGGKHAFVITGYRDNPKDGDFKTKDLKKVVTIYDPTTDDFQDLVFDEFVRASLERPASLNEFSHYLNYVQIQSMTED